jgi:hypothetical protein
MAGAFGAQEAGGRRQEAGGRRLKPPAHRRQEVQGAALNLRLAARECLSRHRPSLRDSPLRRLSLLGVTVLTRTVISHQP